MNDPLIEALKADREEQPDKPEFTVGQSIDGAVKFLSVNRVSTEDRPGGLECATTLLDRRRFMVTFPASLTGWVVASLGAYLDDDEWDRAAEDRLDEMAERAEA